MNTGRDRRRQLVRELLVVLRGDLRYHLRDPATIVMMVLVPVLLLPLLGWGFGRFQAARERDLVERVVRVAAPPELCARIEAAEGLSCVPGSLSAGSADVELAWGAPGPPRELRLRYDPTASAGREARDRARELLSDLASEELSARLELLGLPRPEQVVRVREIDVASEADRQGGRLGRFLPMALVFLVMGGGLYTALDLFAGERERGTLETLMSARVEPAAVLGAKYLVVFLFALVSTLLALASLGGSAAAGLLGERLAIGPGVLLAAFALMLPLVVELTALLVLSAAYAPSFKAGQAMALPLILGAVAPAGVAALPGVHLGVMVALLPVSNLAVALRDLLAGDASAPLLLLAGIAACLHAAAMLAMTARNLDGERFVLGRPGAGERRALGRFGPDAAILFALCLALLWFVGQVAQAVDLAWGTLLSQLGLLALPALGALALLGLSLRDRLQLRLPSRRDLVLALAAGLSAPALSLLVSAGWRALVPSPSRLFDSDLLEGRPPWLVLLLFAALPAVCEETLFRGAILGLLRRSLGPAARCAVVGLAFGVFHLSLVRVAPTASLGVLLAAAALRSRSLLVPVAIHGIHNALLLLALGSGLEPGRSLPVLALGALASVAAVGLMGRR